MRKLMLLAGVAALAAAIPALARDGGDSLALELDQSGPSGALRFFDDDDDDDDGRGRRWRGGGDDDDDGRRRSRRWRSGDDDDDDDDGGWRSLSRQERLIERELRRERRMIRAARRDYRRDLRDWRAWNERRFYRDRLFDDLVIDDRGSNLALGSLVGALIGQRLPIANLGYNVPDRYRYRFIDDGDDFYRYDSRGYVYRFDRDSGLIDAIFPLAGRSLVMGEPMPIGYDVYNVPFAYRGYYPDTSDHLYRYDDGAIYRVNSDSRLVEGVVAMLGGGGLGGLGVGDVLPAGYDVYNVPFAYRDTYYDSDEHLYRYADGALYQVDPQTRLIQSVISLIA